MRDTFKVPKFGTIAGCMVTEGRITRAGDTQARLLRDNVVVYEGKIGSLRRFKDDVSEVKSRLRVRHRLREVQRHQGRRRDRSLRHGASRDHRLMAQGSRPERVADQIRGELASLLTRDVHDPGIGFCDADPGPVSRPDLQQAHVYYTALGDEKSRRNTELALARATAVSAPPDRRPAAAEADAGADVSLRRIDCRTGSDRAAAQRDPASSRRHPTMTTN